MYERLLSFKNSKATTSQALQVENNHISVAVGENIKATLPLS